MWKYLVLVTLLTCSSANAQMDLPGVDPNEKPGDAAAALETVLDCGAKTNDLLSIPEVYASLLGWRQAAAVRFNTQELCEAKESSVVCSLDYAGLQSDYQTVCEANGGIYDENDHQVACAAPDDPTMDGPVIYRFTYYPTCFSNECSDSDIERWIADEVDDLENNVELDASWICDSDYQIEETTPPVAGPSGGGTCPNRANDTPENCGPLADQIESQDCDCYAFCDGLLVECEKFSTKGASDVFCPGELIMGCTDELFSTYSTQLASSGMKAASMVAAVSSMVVALMF